MAETVSTDELRLREALAGRYSIERELGRGGMGVVYLARDVMLDRRVALKVLRWTLATATARERFVREARTAAALVHPNIVPIHAVDELGEWSVITMAFIDGGTLADRLVSEGRLAPRITAQLLRDVAHALAHAHRQGVVHRDVKPENILIDRESGRAMLADFGIAQSLDSSNLTGTGELVGTPLYMSPEQASGEPVDGRSDLYALGVIGYRCLAGRHPFTGSSPREVLAQHLTQSPRSIRQVAPETPRVLARAIDRCLRKQPADREENAAALAAALESSVAPRAELPASLADWVGRHGEVSLLEATFVPILGVGIFFFLEFMMNPLFAWENGPRKFDDESGMLVTMCATIVVYVARRIHLLRRVRRAGYEPAALHEALASTTLAQRPGTWRRLRAVAPRLAAGGVLAWLISLVAGEGWEFGEPAALLYAAFALSCAAGLLIGGFFRLLAPGKSAAQVMRRRFWRGPLAQPWFRLIGLGMRKRSTAEFGNQQTAVALGSAALVLYGGLPRALRQRLAAVPQVLTELEEAAAQQRSRIEALDRLETGPPRLPMDTDLERQRADIESEVLAARSKAVARLHRLITAIELLRLDLLRLHAQGGDVGSITANIEAAMELSDRVARDEAAQVEIEGYLAVGTPT